MRMLFSLIESASCKKGNHMQIAGSSAIVVGGAGGLGEATVRRLHGAGAKVVVADRRGGVAGTVADLGRHARRPGQWRPAGRQGRFPAGSRRLQEDDRVLPD